ncbi:MAG: alanine--glyoxylate aminotransferase family protein [Methanobrevibacter sp.]|jgi:aspartate aminotransferase-like enzyme|uniref:pyridoxal-phosphate-dependent aminotransferase family protein n=1 Tax=Methanobrevibacter sp. TaxID=66852 RepID=UPI0025CE4B77|nr:aminotransferase class V-fold PLP-dependent enzyme [Methanobrevibacter sp.]MBE6498168.1 alanine--glyoxylate aminotransferase family protein [Methanobrevibacter sp.]
MLNFTVGPVMSSDEVRKIGGEQTPYFRNDEFSEVMFENEKLMKEFVYGDENSRVVFITGSGTAAMEATVMNVFSTEDKVLVVNGGGFGQRFADLCDLHNIPFEDIKLDFGEDLTPDILNQYADNGFTGFLVNICETSSGVHYDLDLISDFCNKNGIFLVVDAISSFLADSINMKEQNINTLITGSQKALACPPGVSIIVLDEKALERVEKNPVKSMYFDLKDALKNGERGQTPFTPAVTILLQINARLKEIKAQGGVEAEIKRISNLAEDFRSRIKDLPLEIKCKNLGNAVTSVYTNSSASEIVNTLKKEYSIWVNPSGGQVADKMFRVGHIGDLTIDDNDKLIDALHDLEKRGILK